MVWGNLTSIFRSAMNPTAFLLVLDSFHATPRAPCRGIARPDIRGTSLLNPIPVPANKSFFMETEFGVRRES